MSLVFQIQLCNLYNCYNDFHILSAVFMCFLAIRRRTGTILTNACCERKNIPIPCSGFCKLSKSSARSFSGVVGRCSKYMDDIKDCLKGTSGYRSFLMALKRVRSIGNVSKVQLYIPLFGFVLYTLLKLDIANIKQKTIGCYSNVF